MDEDLTASPTLHSSTSPSYPILPKYPELIFEAIAAVDEKKGANKSAISRQIEATYGSLPTAHWTLLSHHLNRMKASGELIIVKNNYVKPDPNASPKRGRGRPPKPKEPLPEGTVVSPPRPRGRPPKPRDPNAPVTTASPKPRGRPPKPRDRNAPVTTASPKPRGRPPKVKDAIDTVASPPKPRGRPPSSSSKKAAPPVSGRKRGRPSKSGGASAVASPPPSGEKRGRGRPRKLQTMAAAAVEA